jgi:arylsulfatase A-like enzyme
MRRPLFLILVAGLAGLLNPARATGPVHSQAQSTPRPNVLVIVTDDQRSDTLAVMPQTRRWLGQGGTTFSQNFVTTPLCCPSRSSILTGRYPHNHGVRTNFDGKHLDQSTTVAAHLHAAGYQTAIAGKFLLFWDLSKPPPNFDRYTITDGTGYRGDLFSVDGRQQRVNEYSTTYIGRRALGYLDGFEANDSKPWFLYVAVQAPHSPFLAEPRYANSPVPPWHPGAGVGEQDRSDKPGFVRNYHVSPDRSAMLRTAQLRTLLSVDDLVGELAAKLRTLGEERDTLVIFTSDNGYMWSEHQLTSKGLPYTESVQVPLMMRWPGHVPAGRSDDRLAANVDITPTVLAAAGLPAPAQPPLDGHSLFGPERRPELLLEFAKDPVFPFPTWASLRTSRFQYVEYYAGDGRTVTDREYYDLLDDPSQLRNRLGDNDPANDPPTGLLSAELRRVRACAGRLGAHACP